MAGGGEPTSSVSTSSASSSNASSSTGTMGVEDCFNGVDDNDDGLVDCADPTCQPAAACVPDPAQWAGPHAAAIFLTGQTQPCPGGWSTPQVTYAAGSIVAPPAMCGCACGAVTGACNAHATLTTYPTGCTAVAGASLPMTDGQCQPLGGFGALVAAKGTPPQPSSTGSCSPAPSKTVPPYTTSNVAVFCAAKSSLLQGGCADGMVCAPRPDAPYKICVAVQGTATCPAGYANKLNVYESFNDTRSCSDCNCGAPANVACSGQIGFFSDPSCGGAPFATLPVNNMCVGLTNGTIPGAGRYTSATIGACTPGPVSPTGNVTINPITMCCQ
jgi:hypothetical protein